MENLIDWVDLVCLVPLRISEVRQQLLCAQETWHLTVWMKPCSSPYPRIVQLYPFAPFKEPCLKIYQTESYTLFHELAFFFKRFS